MGKDLTGPSATTGVFSSPPVPADRGPSGAPYVLVLGGPAAGNAFCVDRTMTIGRDEQADIRVLDQGMSRKHARLVHSEGHVLIQDLQSTNGTALNGRRIDGARDLRDGDKISLGATTVLKFTYHYDAEKSFRPELQKRAGRDGLTGARTRKYLDEHLRSEFAEAQRHGWPLALLLIEVDDFKSVNDTWGDRFGDGVLVSLSRRIEAALRAEDTFARYSGEEFAILCRDTSAEQSRDLGERIRLRVGDSPFRFPSAAEQPLSMSVSIGIGQFTNPGPVLWTGLVAAAARALEEARQGGGNRVCLASPVDGGA